MWQRNRQSQASFAGVACDYENNADVVGATTAALNAAINVAINVLARGHRVAAGAQDGSGRGRKTTAKPASTMQEPTAATVREGTHVSHRRNPPPSGRGGCQRVTGRRPRARQRSVAKRASAATPTRAPTDGCPRGCARRDDPARNPVQATDALRADCLNVTSRAVLGATAAMALPSFVLASVRNIDCVRDMVPIRPSQRR
jgi:hypothetical protein